MHKKIYCMDCNKELSRYADYYGYKRCGSCSQKFRFKNPENTPMYNVHRFGQDSPRWLGGKPNCLDCGKRLSTYSCKRCTKCSKIGKNNPMYGRSRFGTKNPNWKGGFCRLPYPVQFNESLKARIILRDGEKCQGLNCNMTRDEHLLIYDRDIEVHHIDYDKGNCKEENLITLCKQCNVRANYDKPYCQEFYTNKVRQLIHGA